MVVDGHMSQPMARIPQNMHGVVRGNPNIPIWASTTIANTKTGNLLRGTRILPHTFTGMPTFILPIFIFFNIFKNILKTFLLYQYYIKINMFLKQCQKRTYFFFPPNYHIHRFRFKIIIT